MSQFWENKKKSRLQFWWGILGILVFAKNVCLTVFRFILKYPSFISRNYPVHPVSAINPNEGKRILVDLFSHLFLFRGENFWSHLCTTSFWTVLCWYLTAQTTNECFVFSTCTCLHTLFAIFVGVPKVFRQILLKLNHNNHKKTHKNKVKSAVDSLRLRLKEGSPFQDRCCPQTQCSQFPNYD